jgi:hypothetical protein
MGDIAKEWPTTNLGRQKKQKKNKFMNTASAPQRDVNFPFPASSISEQSAWITNLGSRILSRQVKFFVT